MRERTAEVEDLIEERDAFRGGELIGVRLRHGLGAAVAAGEGTGLSHFPVDVDGGLRVVAGGVSGQDVQDGLRLTGYFLEQRVLAERNQAMPDARRRLAGVLDTLMSN